MKLTTSGVIQPQLSRSFHKASSKIFRIVDWACYRCIASKGEYFEGDHSGIQKMRYVAIFTALVR